MCVRVCVCVCVCAWEVSVSASVHKPRENKQIIKLLTFNHHTNLVSLSLSLSLSLSVVSACSSLLWILLSLHHWTTWSGFSMLFSWIHWQALTAGNWTERSHLFLEPSPADWILKQKYIVHWQSTSHTITERAAKRLFFTCYINISWSYLPTHFHYTYIGWKHTINAVICNNEIWSICMYMFKHTQIKEFDKVAY